MDEKEKSAITIENSDNAVSVEEQDTSAQPEQQQQQEVADTPSVDEAPAVPEVPSTNETPEPEPDPQPVEQTFTQSRVNELVGRARQEGRESALKELFNRYGVNTDDELNEVFGRGQAYDGLNDEYSAMNNSYKELSIENALLKSEVAPERYEDVKLILTGKGYDVTVENIAMLLPSHPEWKGSNTAVSTAAPQPALSPNGNNATAPAPQIRQLSPDASPETVESDEERAMKLYGL